MMHKKRWAAFVLAAALVLTGCSAGSFLHFGKGSGGSTVQKIDRPAVESAELQFTHPAAGDTVAVFDTSAGVFRAVLFPENAPQACDNFIGLVQQGYYNGLTVSRVENQFVVEAGQGADGKGSTIWKGNRYPVEASDSLHHYAGALCMGVDASGACASVFYVVESLPGEQSVTQELVDQMIIKLRIVRFLRTPEYNDLFSGDPVWATLEVGGIGVDGRSMVTKNDYRFLHTLENMGPSPEPNLTVLYSSALPENFKKYAADISIRTSSIQYENDDVMKPVWGDDYSICCCVSATQTGKEMQFFGARANLAKCLLYAINGGVDVKTGQQVGPEYKPITSEYLDYDEVIEKYDRMMDWLADLYVNVLNLIQYMHDKYYYEAAEMALIDTDVRRTFATGIAGFSHVVDSLSAIKYAKVKTIRNEDGIVVDYETTGDFPRYGNDDDRADEIAVWLLKTFLTKIKKHHTYRNSEPTTSILTITSNVVYGKATGALPDGRPAYTPFAPGASPSYGAEKSGLLASLNSVAKLPYEYALDGISNTQTMAPSALGHDLDEQKTTLVRVMDGYFDRGAHHLNVNVFGTEKLLDAQAHPEKPEYANFTIRVSGYAVKFISLTKEQQDDVIARTCHKSL